jgi:hypothetical protein
MGHWWTIIQKSADGFVVAQFKAICLNFLCLSEITKYFRTFSASGDWRQQGRSLMSGQFDCRFYFVCSVGWNFQNTVLSTSATCCTASEVHAVYPPSMILRTNKLFYQTNLISGSVSKCTPSDTTDILHWGTNGGMFRLLLSHHQANLICISLVHEVYVHVMGFLICLYFCKSGRQVCWKHLNKT